MVRSILFIIVFLLATGCAGHFPLGLGGSEEALFKEGAEEIASNNPPKSLERLKEKYPESPWAERAKTLGELWEVREKLLREQNKLGKCNEKSRALDKEIRELRADIDRLKRLMIEMELRSK